MARIRNRRFERLPHAALVADHSELQLCHCLASADHV
jgi:hypothetical protein